MGDHNEEEDMSSSRKSLGTSGGRTPRSPNAARERRRRRVKREKSSSGLTPKAQAEANEEIADEDGALVVERIVRRVPIFADVSDEFVTAICSRLVPMEFGAGDTIMREGDAGHEMFILSQGEVDIVIGGDNVVASLGMGSFFGEVALLKDTTRNATVRTKDACSVLRLDKKDFDALLAEHADAKNRISEVGAGRDRARQVVEKVPIFQGCDETFIGLLVRKLQPQVFEKGEFVITEGDAGNEMYILDDGEVEVIVGKDKLVVAKLGPGSFFGEIALLRNTRRNASIRAVNRCQTFLLFKQDLDAALEDYPEYLERINAVIAEKEALREAHLMPLHLAVRSGERANIDAVLKDEKHKDVNAKDDAGWTPAHEAANAGQVTALQYLIELGAKLEERNEDYSTPIHLAAQSGFSECVNALVGAGVQITTFNNDGYTPLHLAAACGAAGACESLIAHQPDLEAEDLHGKSPLDLACNVGSLACVDLLLAAGADFDHEDEAGCTCLHHASLCGSTDVVAALLTAGADLDAPDFDGGTPLQYAANSGSAAVARKLLDAGADPNEADINGHIPLHHAAFDGNMICVTVMREAGANIRTRGQDGMVPFMFAQMGGNEEIAESLYFEEAPLVMAIREGDLDEMVRLVEEDGVDVTYSHEDDGWAAMHEAATHGYTDAIQFLFDHGADVNVEAVTGTTPLHMAASNSHREAVELLLQLGARADPLNHEFRNALHFAAKNGDADMAALLLAHGADASQVDKHGQTAANYFEDHDATGQVWAEVMSNAVPDLHVLLTNGDMDAFDAALASGQADVNKPNEDGLTLAHLAAYQGNMELLRKLIDSGADLSAGYNGGYTPLHMACQGGETEAAEMLIEAGADVNAVAEDGMTPLLCVDYATQRTDEDGEAVHVEFDPTLLDAIVAAGADLDAANEDGYVYYPNVNVVEEMADMMSSSRSFQMNVDVMNTAKSMMQRILTLGQQ